MPSPKISVIIPVYNAGPFLRKRIESLIYQTLREIEIILVLDCPTDGSDIIAAEYAEKDSRILLIHNKTNLHIGYSRNEGLKKATGEFVGFMDHDDYCDTDMLEQMYEKAKEEQADVVVSCFNGVSPQKTTFYGFPTHYTNNEFQKASFSFLISGPCNHNPSCSITSNFSVWTHIFSRKLLNDHHIMYQDNRVITFEDRLFLIEVYHFAKNVVVIHKAFTYHLYHPGNSGSAYFYRANDRIINYLTYIHQFLDSQKILEENQIQFSDNVLLSLYSGFRNELKHSSLTKVMREISDIRHNALLQKALKIFLKKKNIHYLKKYAPTKLCFLFLAINFFSK